MLKASLINPDIISKLSHMGHGDKILIVDGNYPLYTQSGHAEKIHLGLRKGLPNAIDVIEALKGVVNFESAEVMTSKSGIEPAIMSDFRKSLDGIPFTELKRMEFYQAACGDHVELAIGTGEDRPFGCIILTVYVA